MATAYAAFTSLTHLITQLHEHPYPPIKLDEKQFENLSSTISVFQRFLEDHHNTIDLQVGIRIADAARAAEDLIEAHIGDQVLDFNGKLQRVIEGLDLIKEEVIEMNQNEPSQSPSATRKPAAVSSHSPFSENIAVGIEDLEIKIVDRLTSQHKSKRQIISISGMGGIGKTTLAKKIYNHPYIKNYFDKCAWVTISKEYNVQRSLLEILHCLGIWTFVSFSKHNKYNWGETLYKYLIGRRYLVILDDVCDVEAWDRLRSFFPDSSGSGIVITTRESSVASIGSRSFHMNFLDEHKSWDLLCKNVFGKDSCPPELEGVGRYVANKCRGLPLSIIVIGGHLAKSARTQTYWEYIADNLSSVVNSENNEHCLRILSLSYTHLPLHLKPCFLYLGIFPEDKEIRVSEIIRLWMVEGILKPINGKSLEEAAEEYLNDLVARNLILASKSSKRGKMKSFKIHDLLRDLCLKKEKKNNFFRVVQKQGLILHSNNELQISLSSFCEPTRIRTLTVWGESPSETDRLLQQLPLGVGCGSLTISENRTIAYSDLVNFQCLEVKIRHASYPYVVFANIPHCVGVRVNNNSYLHSIMPQLFCFHWNLQSLVILVDGKISAPPEIWKMPQLRHIKIRDLYLPNPPSESIDILRNLQCARRIRNFEFSDNLVKRVPDVKKLKVCYDFSIIPDALNNIARLEKLESFGCSFDGVRSISTRNGGVVSNLTFPHSLKKLSIDCLDWDDVTNKIGTLPLLEVLKLSDCAGCEWKLVEGQFVRLKYLALKHCSCLQCFTADNNHFPCLQELNLQNMPCLKEISSDVGDIPTLMLIELDRCLDSVVVAAKEIADYQYENGNEELQIKAWLHVTSRLSLLSTSNFHADGQVVRGRGISSLWSSSSSIVK